MSKDKNYTRMIQSSQWKELRIDKMKNNPLCEDCYENEIIEPATEVHHVIPVESALSLDEMKRLMFSYDNLRALCHSCHIEAHKAMKSHSREEVRRNTDRKNERFKSRFL
jgi:5-methylcytosine-specific restriction protein A